MLCSYDVLIHYAHALLSCAMLIRHTHTPYTVGMHGMYRSAGHDDSDDSNENEEGGVSGWAPSKTVSPSLYNH
jgi:hypothetical protein